MQHFPQLVYFMHLTLIDFDLYLLRPGSHDIVLNPTRAIADYGVSKNVSEWFGEEGSGNNAGTIVF